jgi:hypothetical protein
MEFHVVAEPDAFAAGTEDVAAMPVALRAHPPAGGDEPAEPLAVLGVPGGDRSE